jgi:DNA invertase Pin-like site-specific DNA recombinase
VYHVFGALAEFQRSLIPERTEVGLAAARVRGGMGGRPKLLDPIKLALALCMRQEGKDSIREICQTIGISKATLYNYLARAKSGAVRAT